MSRNVQDKNAGKFSSWLNDTMASLRGKGDAEVECGECAACCNSSYFIHVRPSDVDALKHIPKELLFPVPGAPKGHLLMGYDEHGRCPMYIDQRCSIYHHRPQTCRQYDCRVFPSTGLTEADRPMISDQANRWQFDFVDEVDKSHFEAVQQAARFLDEYADHFPPGFVPPNPAQQAVLALTVHDVFTNKMDDVEKIVSQVMAKAEAAR